MQAINISINDRHVLIDIDKSATTEEKVNDAINYLKLLFLDDSHIPSVDDNEQKEIESVLDSLSEEDKKIAFEETVKI